MCVRAADTALGAPAKATRRKERCSAASPVAKVVFIIQIAAKGEGTHRTMQESAAVRWAKHTE